MPRVDDGAPNLRVVRPGGLGVDHKQVRGVELDERGWVVVRADAGRRRRKRGCAGLHLHALLRARDLAPGDSPACAEGCERHGPGPRTGRGEGLLVARGGEGAVEASVANGRRKDREIGPGHDELGPRPDDVGVELRRRGALVHADRCTGRCHAGIDDARHDAEAISVAREIGPDDGVLAVRERGNRWRAVGGREAADAKAVHHTRRYALGTIERHPELNRRLRLDPRDGKTRWADGERMTPRPEDAKRE